MEVGVLTPFNVGSAGPGVPSPPARRSSDGLARRLVLALALVGVTSCADQSNEPNGGPHTWPLPPGDSLLIVEEWQPASSPDGRTIAFSHEVKPGHEVDCGTFGIYRVDLASDSVGVPELVVPVSGAMWLSFAPDGRRVAYVFGAEIWVADVFSKEVRRLTFQENAQKPSWNPRVENLLVYNRIEAVDVPADSGAIRFLDVYTLKDTPVHTRSGRVLYGGAPAWDPSGKSIIYSRYERETRGLEIFRVYPDSTEEIRLTHTGWSCEYPKWFDDGRQIAFRINAGGLRDPDFPDWWVVSANGGFARPFFDIERQVEVGSSMTVRSGGSSFVLTRPSQENSHWLALWILSPLEDGGISWRQITGPGSRRDKRMPDQ